ncbi:MAG: elongation factor G [Hyphomonadaceae bacterium]
MSSEGAVRAIGLVGPTGAGKTLLRRALEEAAGAKSNGADARAPAESGPDIAFSAISFLGDRFAIVDAPGSLEFAADADQALAAADLALIVVDPDPEKAALAQPYIRHLEALGAPHALFVNKIDQARGRLRDLLEALQPYSKAPLVARQIPIWRDEKITGYVDLALERAYLFQPGKPSQRIDIPEDMREREHEARFHMLEQLADFDDALMEQLLSDEAPANDTVFADLTREVREGLITPVFFGSALNGFGMRRLLKALRHETPAPQAAALRLGIDAPAALTLKVSYAGQAGKLAYARLFNTTLADGADIVLADGATRRASGLQGLNGAGLKKAQQAAEGEIIALAKLDELRVGESAGVGRALHAAKRAARAPMFDLAVRAKDRKDDVRLGMALTKLAEEDPGLTIVHDADMQEVRLSGQGETHLRQRVEALKKRFNVDVEVLRPQTAYKESIRKAVTQRGRHKKQTGGHGQFGDVVIEARPLPRGEGFIFEDRISGGVVPKQWIPAVEQGVRDAMEKGPLGFRVVDVAVTLIDGSFHSVDSSEQAFRMAGRIAMSEALKAGEPFLLEPIEKLTIMAPASATSRINGAVTSRNGQILGFEGREGWTEWDRIDVYLPHAERQDFIHELKGLTQGMGAFEASFDHLVEISGRRADDVLKARAAH